MNDVQFLHRQHEPAVDRPVEAPPEIFPDARPGRRGRRGGWFLGLGVLLVLAGGLSLGGWRHVSRVCLQRVGEALAYYDISQLDYNDRLVIAFHCLHKSLRG